MIIIAFFAPLLLALFASRIHDPGPGLFASKQDAAKYDCKSSSSDSIQREQKLSNPNSSRGNYFNETLFRCQTLFFARGERAAGPDALLRTLDESLTRILTLAKQEVPKQITWGAYVQAVDADFAYKIRFAVEVQLASLNEKVESEMPEVSAERITELAKENTEDSLEDFCNDLPSENKAWVGIGQLDTKETQFQGGLCYKGVWKWLL